MVVCDPHVEELPALLGPHRVAFGPQEIALADLVVLVTDHDVFDRDLVTRYATQVLDTRHVLEGDRVEHL